jgi:hypothetical protein
MGSHARNPLPVLGGEGGNEMSYENTQCPCGGHKPRETMICPACEIACAGHDLIRYRDDQSPVESRRNAAIRILAKARRRKSQPRLSLNIPCT